MFSRVRIGQAAFILLGAGILFLSAAASSADRGAAPGTQVVSGDHLTRQQFEALPDSALIEFKGRRMTKASILAKEAKSREVAGKVEALARQNRVEFEQRLVQFERQQEAKLELDKAKATAEFARMSQANSRQIKAIEVEATRLYERSLRASPAERARIDQRANQLLQQLQTLEQR